jgi:hypothetical protein
MKLSIKKLLSLLGFVLLTGSAASAATVIPSDLLLGTVAPATPAGDSIEIARINFLVTSLNSGNFSAVAYSGAGVDLGDAPEGIDPNTETYTLWHPAGLVLNAPAASLTGSVKDESGNTTVDLGAFQYDYLLAKYGDDNAIFWIGDLSGEIEIPNLVNRNGLSHFVLINPRDANIPPPSNVPDGGTTVALLGLAISGMGLMRRWTTKA